MTSNNSSERRSLSSKDLAYDSLYETWQGLVSNYDTQRRVETLIQDWLPPELLQQARVLEAGCGLGYFSEQLAKAHPKQLVVTDIAPALVRKLSERIPSIDCRVADIMDLVPSLGDRQFDVVLSSEVIEHTPNPKKAVDELCARVAPNGFLVISCPNRRWIWILRLAQLLGLRKHYKGYENWVKPKELKAWVVTNGLSLVKTEGIHTVPWHFLPKRLLRFIDRRLRERNYGLAVNLALMARRPIKPN